MRAFKLFVVLLLTILVMIGCQTDYTGQILPNQKPDLAFNTYNPNQMYLTKRKIRVGWHCNDLDGMKTKFYYAVSSDPAVNVSNVFTNIAADKWKVTDKPYADIAFPFDGIRDTLFTDTSTNVTTRYAWSNLYLYAVDENGNKTNVVSRDFWRTNTKPKVPRVECPSFLWDADHLPPVTSFVFNEYQATTLPRVFLKEQTSFWNPVMFRWSSDDADGEMGDKVTLDYKWELYKVPFTGIMTDAQIMDSNFVCSLPAELIASSGDWDPNNTTLSLDHQVFDAGEGYFKFVVRVKDDGNEEAVSPCINFFEAFRPKFDKGILLYNTTTLASDPGITPQSTITGNPDKEVAKEFYKNMMTALGYSETSADPLKQYEYYDKEVMIGSTLTHVVPNLKLLSQYRLIISIDDDRLNKQSTFYDDKETFFGAQMRVYLDMGGKVLIAGNNRFYDNSGTAYTEPKKYSALKVLLKDYFGLSAITTGECYEPKKSSNYKNYDFLGLDVFSHVQDTLLAMTVDPVKINTYWKKANNNNNYYKIKGDGIFMPSVATVKALDGEIIFGYKSVYNDPVLSLVDSLTTAGGWSDGVVNPSNTKPVLNRNDYDGLQPGVRSAVASRYIPTMDNFRTAYIGVPLFFMDNTNNNVYTNMKKMVKWFDLTQVPQSVVTTKK